MNTRTADALADAGMTSMMTRVYDLLIQDGAMPRELIVQKLHVPRTTVFDASALLEKRGLIARMSAHVTGQSRGRPKVLWYIVHSGEED